MAIHQFGDDFSGGILYMRRPLEGFLSTAGLAS
jgi:hypothetical protein